MRFHLSLSPTLLYEQLGPAFHAEPASNLGSHVDSTRATDSVDTTVGPDHGTPLEQLNIFVDKTIQIYSSLLINFFYWNYWQLGVFKEVVKP